MDVAPRPQRGRAAGSPQTLHVPELEATPLQKSGGGGGSCAPRGTVCPGDEGFGPGDEGALGFGPGDAAGVEDEDGGSVKLGGEAAVMRRGEEDGAPVAELANPWPWHGPSEGDDDGFSATVYPRARARGASPAVSAPTTETFSACGEEAAADTRPAEQTRPAAQEPRGAPAPASFPPHRSPQLAVPQPPGPEARAAPHPFSHGPLPPEPLYSPNAPYPGRWPLPPHRPAAGPYHPAQPTYAASDGHAPHRPAARPPPLPPRSAPGPYASPLTGFGSHPRNAVPYSPPPRTLYTPPLPAARPRAAFGGSSARRWLDKTNQMLETKLDEVLQGPTHRPAYRPGAGPPGSSRGGPPAPGHGRRPGGSWGGGSYRYYA